MADRSAQVAPSHKEHLWGERKRSTTHDEGRAGSIDIETGQSGLRRSPSKHTFAENVGRNQIGDRFGDNPHVTRSEQVHDEQLWSWGANRRWTQRAVTNSILKNERLAKGSVESGLILCRRKTRLAAEE